MALGLLLLLFSHSFKGSLAQEERLTTSPYLVTRPHLPHAMVVRLHVAIHTPGTAASFGVKEMANCSSRTKPWMLPGPRHRGLTTMLALFTRSYNWELRREQGAYGTHTNS